MTTTTKPNNSPAAEIFAIDCHGHQLTIHQDQGLYRHLRFTRPGSSVVWFDLITWPGALAISGGHGGHIFRRVDDMFTFFRGHSIKPGYWAEKLDTDRDSVRAYSETRFRERVEDETDNATAAYPELHDAVNDLVFGVDTESEDDALHAAAAFEHWNTDPDGKVIGEPFRFTNVWKWDVHDWDFHYLWSLHAIVWGIAQYDLKRSLAEVKA